MGDDLTLAVGELQGRVKALESRADRHETTVHEQLTSINGKLDKVVTQLAEGRGKFGLLHWLVTTAIAGAAALAGWWHAHVG
jgi:hypothetical protein